MPASEFLENLERNVSSVVHANVWQVQIYNHPIVHFPKFSYQSIIRCKDLISTTVEASDFKSEGHGFDSRWLLDNI